MNENDNNTTKKYEKPTLKIEKSDIDSEEAYSAAAVPAAAPAIAPSVYSGSAIVAAVFTKYC